MFNIQELEEHKALNISSACATVTAMLRLQVCNFFKLTNKRKQQAQLVVLNTAVRHFSFCILDIHALWKKKKKKESVISSTKNINGNPKEGSETNLVVLVSVRFPPAQSAVQCGH